MSKDGEPRCIGDSLIGILQGLADGDFQGHRRIHENHELVKTDSSQSDSIRSQIPSTFGNLGFLQPTDAELTLYMSERLDI